MTTPLFWRLYGPHEPTHSPHGSITPVCGARPGCDGANYEDKYEDGGEADGEAGETSASTEAGCSDTLDLPRLIRVQSLWGHTTPAILGIRGREASTAEFQKHWHMVYFVLAEVTDIKGFDIIYA